MTSNAVMNTNPKDWSVVYLVDLREAAQEVGHLRRVGVKHGHQRSVRSSPAPGQNLFFHVLRYILTKRMDDF